jgi:Flp pilus assembly protein TadG
MRIASHEPTRRRGAVVPLVALLVVFLLGMVAFGVDVGWIVLTKSELQNAADSAALAGVKSLMDGYVQYNLPNLTSSQKSTILTNAENNATTAAQTYAAYHTAGGVSNLSLKSSDVQFGFTNASGSYSTTFTGFPNTIKVTMRRDSTANGTLKLFFGPVLGASTTNLTASAAATMYGGTANSFQTTLTDSVSLLPLAYDVNAWTSFLSTGLDPDGNATLSGGLPAIAVYPSSKYAGNFGQLSLDGSHVGDSTEVSWVNNGLSQTDLDSLFRAGLLPVSPTNSNFNWIGDTGMKTSLISAINNRVGTQFMLPLFTPYNNGVPNSNTYSGGNGQGKNYYYDVVQMVGVTVVTGPSGNVVVQPSAFMDPNLSFSSTPTPVGTGTSLVTTFAAPKLTQ